MFGLTDEEILAGPVLDCPGGAGAFASGVRSRGGEAVNIDPAYDLAPDELVARVRVGLDHGMRYLEDDRGSYVWSFFPADFTGQDERYLAGALPRLPLADRAFRLVLSGYLLLAYPDHLDHGGTWRSKNKVYVVRRARTELLEDAGSPNISAIGATEDKEERSVRSQHDGVGLLGQSPNSPPGRRGARAPRCRRGARRAGSPLRPTRSPPPPPRR